MKKYFFVGLTILGYLLYSEVTVAQSSLAYITNYNDSTIY